MESIKLKIGKIHCDSCNELINDILIEDVGVSSCEFESSDVALVKFDSKKVSVEKIKQEIINAGYSII